MKTPQQIRNEVEKEIEKIELEDRRDWDDMDYWNWKVLKEELETLNKCEEAFKEMIKDYFNFLMDYFSRSPTEINKAIVLLIANMKQELLSKIGDNSEVEK